MLKGSNAGGAWYPALTQAIPPNPPAGQFRMYAKSGSTSLFYRNSFGVEFELAQGSIAGLGFFEATTTADVSSGLSRASVESYALRVLAAQNFR